MGHWHRILMSLVRWRQKTCDSKLEDWFKKLERDHDVSELVTRSSLGSVTVAQVVETRVPSV